MGQYDAPSSILLSLKQTFHGFFPGSPKFTEKDYPASDGKVVIITGATTGVGYQTAKSLAALTNAKIYFFTRNEKKSLDAIKRLEEEVAKEYSKKINPIHFIDIDLSDLTTIKPAVEKFLSVESKLDIIIHNAGVMGPKWGSKSAQGYELQLGVNALGHHLLQKLLDPLFIETAKSSTPNQSRVVWVSSTAQFSAPLGGLDLDDPNLSSGGSKSLYAYAQSKAVNAVQARYWAKVHATEVNESGIVSVSLCPGFLHSDLARDFNGVAQWIASLLTHNVRKGAYTELFAALSPDITTKDNGKHIISFGKIGILRKDLDDDAKNKKVWDWLEGEVKAYA